MFNMGMTELLLIGAIALVVLGPKKMPQAARTLGKFIREAKKMSNNFKASLQEELEHQVGPDAKDLSNLAKDLRMGTRAPSDIAEALEQAAEVLDKSNLTNEAIKQNRAQAQTAEGQGESVQSAPAPAKPDHAKPTRAPGHSAPTLDPPKDSNPV